MISDKHLNDEIDVRSNRRIDIGFYFDSLIRSHINFIIRMLVGNLMGLSMIPKESNP